jgi:sterol desaturase/sphingolipid hydroxylase (fatty acid hydroxylase superfamily)
MNLLFGTSLLLALIMAELAFQVKVKGKKLPWKEIVTNVNSGHIMQWLFRGMILIAYAYLSDNYSLGFFVQIPIALQWLFLFFAWDFLFYWSHRMHHTIGFLWKIHSTHHQPEHFNLSVGIRNSWFQPLTSFPFYIILAFMGVPTEQFMLISAIHYFIQFYNHNSLVKKSGFLEKIFVTPSHHRVHHGINKEYLDKNHGGTFIFWDKLFGTFQAERDDIEIVYGTTNHTNPHDPFWANIGPLVEFLNRSEKKRKPLALMKHFTISGSFLLFLLLLIYINYEQVWSFGMLAPLFLIVFSGTLILGSISNEHVSGLIAWSLLTIPCILVYILIMNISDATFLGILIATVVHGLIGTWSLFKMKISGKNKLEVSDLKP